MFLYEDKSFIGRKIKQIRVAAKLSQAELSEKIGMSEKNLSNIERGLQIPALNSFLKLLDILNIPLSEFGINAKTAKSTENKHREELLKEIYLSNSKEIETYLTIIKAVKSLND